MFGLGIDLGIGPSRRRSGGGGAVAGASPTTFAINPVIHYHIPAGSTVTTTTITVAPANVEAATLVTDIRGNHNASNGALTGPILLTDGLGRKFLRFTNIPGNSANGDGPNGPNVLQIDSAFLPNNRAMAVFAMVRAHNGGAGALFILGGSTLAANGLGVTPNNSGNSPFIKYGTRYANNVLDGDTTKMLVHSGVQAVGYVGRTTTGVANSPNTGALLYHNTNRCRVTLPTSLTATTSCEIGDDGAAAYYDVYEMAIFTGQLTDAQADAISAAMVANWSIPAITNQIILEGDSITAGIKSVSSPTLGFGVISSVGLGMQLTEPGTPLIPATCRVINQGVSGDTVSNLVTRRDAAGSVYSASGLLSGGRNIVAPHIGRNNWTGTTLSGTDTYNEIVALINTTTTGYLQRGFEVVQAINIANGGVEPSWQQQRTLLRAAGFLTDTLSGTGQAFDGKVSRLELPLISVGGVTPFSTAADTSNATYWQPSDTTHPNRVGTALMATGGDTPANGYGSIL